jgi:YVTN family beta-propeller protein
VWCAAASGAVGAGANSPAQISAGINLLRNGGGGVGATSVQGWDSVTIPGWQVAGGLPTVVRYGTPGFATAGRARFGRPARLFAGGPGGPAHLAQSLSLRSRSGAILSPDTRYRLSGWLGGNAKSDASVTVRFLSATGRSLGQVTIGPVGDGKASALRRRTASAPLPRGTVGVRIAVRLATSLKNFDGADAPKVGYNRAVAGGLSFSVTRATKAWQPLRPPAARVPRFDHVFVFMFENQDYRRVIGNRRQAPYLNSLVPKATLLSNLFAEEHPSDGNYLALAAGGVFGLPLTDPLEINPRYTVNARNIGGLLDSAHETWRGYLQSAAGPCDDTVHRYYWNDDLPFLYFHDIRDRPAYCASHVVPLEAIDGDLSSPKSTPNFAWIGANDCSDMEGCGIRQGDRFLAHVLRRIVQSPAWKTQRSMAIITFDEDAYDHEHPPQLVPTLVLGSRAVRRGFVSHARYTHYSLLRTIEAALRLGALTRNDLYAQPVNDAFLAHPIAQLARAAAVHRRPRGTRGAGPMALVANSSSGSVTPVSLSSGKAGASIRVGNDPVSIGVAHRQHIAYVVNHGSNTVTPIDTTTLSARRPIPVGSDPTAIALTTDGSRAYVVNSGSNTVTPINTRTSRPDRAIRVGTSPRTISLVRGGRIAYVLNWGESSVTPIDVATNRPGPKIPVGSYPSAIASSPSGRTAYIANFGSSSVTPIATATGHARPPIAVGQAPDALALTPDGSRLEVVSGDLGSVTPIDTRTARPGHPIRVGRSPEAVVVSRAGPTAWVVNTLSGTVTPIATRTGRAGHPISVGLYSYPTEITLSPNQARALVVEPYGGGVTLIDTRTRKVLHKAKTGSYPVAAAVVR